MEWISNQFNSLITSKETYIIFNLLSVVLEN